MVRTQERILATVRGRFLNIGTPGHCSGNDGVARISIDRLLQIGRMDTDTARLLDSMSSVIFHLLNGTLVLAYEFLIRKDLTVDVVFFDYPVNSVNVMLLGCLSAVNVTGAVPTHTVWCQWMSAKNITVRSTFAPATMRSACYGWVSVLGHVGLHEIKFVGLLLGGSVDLPSSSNLVLQEGKVLDQLVL